MSIKDSLPSSGPGPAGPVHALSGVAVVTLDGPQAEAFAQAQFMNDLRPLSPGQWQWSGWLNPKGRVIALFALLREQPERLWLVLIDAEAEAFVARLQQFVFRSKVRLQIRSDYLAASDWAPWSPSDDTADRARIGSDGSFGLNVGTASAPRSLWLLPRAHAALLAANADNDSRWRDYDINHGFPRLDRSQTEAWTPQKLSLERLSAYSVKKGCYPGQEIVARTHFLGQAKRALVGLQGSRLAPAQPITAGEQALGQVLCASIDGQRGLAVLSPHEAATELHNDSQPCRLFPLLEGLRRPR